MDRPRKTDCNAPIAWQCMLMWKDRWRISHGQTLNWSNTPNARWMLGERESRESETVHWMSHEKCTRLSRMQHVCALIYDNIMIANAQSKVLLTSKQCFLVRFFFCLSQPCSFLNFSIFSSVYPVFSSISSGIYTLLITLCNISQFGRSFKFHECTVWFSHSDSWIFKLLCSWSSWLGICGLKNNNKNKKKHAKESTKIYTSFAAIILLITFVYLLQQFQSSCVLCTHRSANLSKTEK